MDHSRQRIVLAVLLALVPISSSMASGEEHRGLEEVVVTGTILNDSTVLQRIPRMVLTSEDIAALAPATVIDLLRTLPGVSASQAGGLGGLGFLSLRGGDPNLAVVLVDGVKVNDPTNSNGGGFDFVGLDPLLIEKIEVLLGSYSAVYGSDALSGIISITTKGAEKASTSELQAEVDSEGMYGTSVHFDGAIGDSLEVAVAGAIREEEHVVEGDSLRRQQATVHLRSAPDEGRDLSWSARMFAGQGERTFFPASSGGDRLAQLRTTERREFSQLNSAAKVEWLPAPGLSVNAAGSWSRYEEEGSNPGIAPGVLNGIPPIESDSTYELRRIQVRTTLSMLETITVGVGVEGARESGNIASIIEYDPPLPTIFAENRGSWAVLGEVVVDLTERFMLLGGIRHDEAGSSKEMTGRLSASLRFPTTGTSLWFSVSEGFKLPSLFALGHPTTGNPALLPELSRNYEARLEQAFRENQAKLTVGLYHTDYRGLIDFDVDTFSHVNMRKVVIEGIDINVSLDLGRNVSVDSSVGYLRSDTKLELRPSWTGSAGIRWDDGGAVSFAAHATRNGKFHDSSIPTGWIEMPGSTRLDATLSWKVLPGLVARLALSDVFDSEKEQAIGFSSPGRRARLSVLMSL